MEKTTIFLVEHMEEYLFNWCKWQYIKMLQYLQSTPILLCFTNCQSFLSYTGPNSPQNTENIDQLRQAFTHYQNSGLLLPQSFNTLLTPTHLDLKQLGLIPRAEVCLLDLRGPKELSKGDTGVAKVFVFGGILGDHPPRDRTKLLRNDIETLRHLGQPQLSTDTAVLVSKLILVDGMELEGIPFVLEPEIRGVNREKKKTVIQMEGFRYVEQVLDWKSGEKKGEEGQGKGEVYMHEEIRRILLEDELDVAAFM